MRKQGLETMFLIVELRERNEHGRQRMAFDDRDNWTFALLVSHDGIKGEDTDWISVDSLQAYLKVSIF